MRTLYLNLTSWQGKCTYIFCAGSDSNLKLHMTCTLPGIFKLQQLHHRITHSATNVALSWLSSTTIACCETTSTGPQSGYKTTKRRRQCFGLRNLHFNCCIQQGDCSHHAVHAISSLANARGSSTTRIARHSKAAQWNASTQFCSHWERLGTKSLQGREKSSVHVRPLFQEQQAS